LSVLVNTSITDKVKSKVQSPMWKWPYVVP